MSMVLFCSEIGLADRLDLFW